MGQYTEIVPQLINYACKVMPEIHRQAWIIRSKKELCTPEPAAHGNSSGSGIRIAGDPYSFDHSDCLNEPFWSDMLCCCLFSLLPAADMKETVSFILSLYALQELLENYRTKRDITDETAVRDLYNCLSCAADPSRSSSCALIGSVKNMPFPVPQTCLADQCRLQLATLPSYKPVSSKIKKYMQLFVDLQSYRHYPAAVSTNYLKTWCSSYLSRYREISVWEFCAAADSFLGIAAMYTAAARPGVTNEEAVLLDEACFPWLSGLSSLLKGAIRIRISGTTENLNFTSFYENLKQCEERILFFSGKAEAACMKLKDSSFYIRLIKTMTALYLTEPEADFGMLRLACGNILKKSSSRPYSNACRLMRLLRVF